MEHLGVFRVSSALGELVEFLSALAKSQGKLDQAFQCLPAYLYPEGMTL
jgi:hypothetical protein